MTTRFYSINHVQGGYYSTSWNGGGFVGSYDAVMQVITQAVARMEKAPDEWKAYVASASPSRGEAIIENA